MRLICPNCEAEYEVDDAAIPDTGRDVQCSNCGHAWFQLPPEIELALEQEDELFGLSGSGSAAPDPLTDPLLDADEDDLPPPPPPLAEGAEAPKRSIDENLMAILREEAEREAAARKAEAAPIETQTEMGLDAPAAAAAAAAAAAVTASAERSSAAGVTPSPAHAGGLAAAARRIAQLKGQDPDAPPPKPATRRDLLPDIEEINSSLKGAEPAAMATEAEVEAGQSNARGFRSGFAVAMVLAVLLLAIYVAAPRIVAMVPATEGAVNAYVAAVDGLRLWLDGAMRSATDAVRQMTAQEG